MTDTASNSPVSAVLLHQGQQIWCFSHVLQPQCQLVASPLQTAVDMKHRDGKGNITMWGVVKGSVTMRGMRDVWILGNGTLTGQLKFEGGHDLHVHGITIRGGLSIRGSVGVTISGVDASIKVQNGVNDVLVHLGTHPVCRLILAGGAIGSIYVTGSGLLHAALEQNHSTVALSYRRIQGHAVVRYGPQVLLGSLATETQVQMHDMRVGPSMHVQTSKGLHIIGPLTALEGLNRSHDSNGSCIELVSS